MQPAQAISLIQTPQLRSSPQTWADLGCGTGTFTLALADLLVSPSTIFAVDQNARALQQLPSLYQDITIKTLQADFVTTDLPFRNLDGILMANALHYVKDKISFLHKLANMLTANGYFLIVEYETSFANPWVPYPIRFQVLQNLFIKIGYHNIIKLNEMPSRYQGKMYAAFIQRPI